MDWSEFEERRCVLLILVVLRCLLKRRCKGRLTPTLNLHLNPPDARAGSGSPALSSPSRSPPLVKAVSDELTVDLGMPRALTISDWYCSPPAARRIATIRSSRPAASSAESGRATGSSCSAGSSGVSRLFLSLVYHVTRPEQGDRKRMTMTGTSGNEGFSSVTRGSPGPNVRRPYQTRPSRWSSGRRFCP